MDELYYCGFNGFRQVPSHPDKQTLTTLVAHCRGARTILDVAICWNYLLVAESDALIKYGLVNGKNGLLRLPLPPSATRIVQVSATPRHLLAITEAGECWAYEESKGWRHVAVGAETEMSTDASVVPGGNSARLIKTSCGDGHNLGVDEAGRAYVLPSPLEMSHRVTDVVCGKEHSLLLTEHGQVFSWGGGSRGQLGHGTIQSEEKPRLVSALDGMRVRRVAAGGWHSACVSQHDDLYMFGWNESGQLAQPTKNVQKSGECFSAVEKILVACCTMQPGDAAAVEREDAELDGEVYHRKDYDDAVSTSGSVAAATAAGEAFASASDHDDGSFLDPSLEKDVATSCYGVSASCNGDEPADAVTVQPFPMLVSLPETESRVQDVACGSRHTVVVTQSQQMWAFGWNHYGQLGLGHNHSRDAPEKVALPRGVRSIKTLRCGDWGTAIVATRK